MKPATVRSITVHVIKRTDGGTTFSVQAGERIETELCWDEMLGAIAEQTHPQLALPGRFMQTPDRLVERMERHAKAFKPRPVLLLPDYQEPKSK